MRDDDDGQVDGDYIPPGQLGSPFAASFGQQPWLRSGLPPWHMWGTIEQVTTIATVSALPATGGTSSQQLSKVAYKRPDTWQWLFFARLVSAPNGGGGGAPAEASVDFDVTIGVGRASVTLPVFERFAWSWPAAPPLSILDYRWSTTGIQPQRITGGAAADHSLLQLVAQDIQVNARVGAAAPVTPSTFVIEVGAFFAPRSHLRPDWLLPGPAPLEAQFAGDEVGGR